MIRFLFANPLNIMKLVQYAGLSPLPYYQAREKFMSLKKGARVDIVAELEEVSCHMVDELLLCLSPYYYHLLLAESS